MANNKPENNQDPNKPNVPPANNPGTTPQPGENQTGQKPEDKDPDDPLGAYHGIKRRYTTEKEQWEKDREELEKIKKEKEDEEQKKKEAEGKHLEIIADLKPKAQKYDELVESATEQFKLLEPELTDEQKALLTGLPAIKKVELAKTFIANKNNAANVGGGANVSGATGAKKKFTADDIAKMSEKEFQNNKEEIDRMIENGEL